MSRPPSNMPMTGGGVGSGGGPGLVSTGGGGGSEYEQDVLGHFRNNPGAPGSVSSMDLLSGPNPTMYNQQQQQQQPQHQHQQQHHMYDKARSVNLMDSGESEIGSWNGEYIYNQGGTVRGHTTYPPNGGNGGGGGGGGERPYASVASAYKHGRAPQKNPGGQNGPRYSGGGSVPSSAHSQHGNTVHHRSPPSEINYLGRDEDGRSVRSEAAADDFGNYLGPNADSGPQYSSGHTRTGGGPAAAAAAADKRHIDFSLRAAQQQSLKEQLTKNRWWRMRALYIDLTKGKWNFLNFITLVGTALTAIISLLSFLGLMGVLEPDTTTRSWETGVEGVIAILWFVAAISASASYLLNNSNLRSQHKARVVFVIFANFLLLLFYFLFIILSNAKYTNIRSPHESESSSEEEHFKDLDLSKGHHWCSDDKVMAGLSYYVAMAYGSLMIIILMPAQIEAWYSHSAPERAADVADYYEDTERYTPPNMSNTPKHRRRTAGSIV